MKIALPALFNYTECLSYLGRSALETRFRIEGNAIVKPFRYGREEFLIRLSQQEEHALIADFLVGDPSPATRSFLERDIRDWLDLDTPLHDFYLQVQADPVMKDFIVRYRGLRIVRVTDLFECLCWVIIGQQINLAFAYQVKKDFVEKYGDTLAYNERVYYHFPTPEVVSDIREEELRAMRFSRQKIAYMKNVARLFCEGKLDKPSLMKLGYEEAKARLTAIKGVGEWSADYVLMRCMNFPDAFPVGDVGLQNALRKALGLEQKPGIQDMHTLSQNWKGWRGYCTFYLWRTLAE